MAKKNQIFSVCIGILLVVALATCVVLVLQEKSVKTSSTDPIVKEIKSLKDFYFESSDAKAVEAITHTSDENITYSDYNFQLDSYIYDNTTDTGYALIVMKDNEKKHSGFDLEQKFYETFEFKFIHQGHYFEALSPRIISDNNTLYLYYMLKGYGNKIIIWDNQSDNKAFEIILENTCENNKKSDTSDGREITVSPIGIKILTEKSTASSEFVYDETKMSEEDLKEYFNDGIGQVDILYKNGDRITAYGDEVTSRTSTNALDGKIERTIRVSKIIDIENIDTIEIKE